jgi:hypothetical protein
MPLGQRETLRIHRHLDLPHPTTLHIEHWFAALARHVREYFDAEVVRLGPEPRASRRLAVG